MTREQVSILTQSRFFSPVFNGAIFDGPIRIYFSQSQEASAMKLYFAVLARLKNQFADLKEQLSQGYQNVFILIYPTKENFNIVFPGDQVVQMQADRLGEDYVIGLNGPMEEKDFATFFIALDQILSSFHKPSVGLDL